ncbi:PHP domain-containing protein [Natronorubrum daqingense]|uniref:Histidinol-phosphatase n=1 Tax=Natronorubrum daqingense TaxID=588898 RepID=A0A1N7EMH3_9EURY|nr:PHP domain-containing protein [Natronorubrum daqingense]APX97856.1 histidinol-phosphatase [Natronorubrum daqingense]SIR89288.1 hypothetical protein SAMN05421809_2709 [Natronorubrum daqingense]
MPYADLHVHTTRSDGSLELEAVPDAARRAGVEVVAVTDHDRLQPFDAPVVERAGVTIVNGIELRVETPSGDRVDLLGYGVEPTEELAALADGIQQNRIERGQAIVDCVESRFGVDLGCTVDDGFGRPHVARAVDSHSDLEFDYEGAFDHLIGYGEPCFVARDVPSFERGLAVLEEACALVSLAHPFRYPHPDAALSLTSHPALEAVEVDYPYDGATVDRELLDETIERYDLLATGGSDAHGESLGVAGLSLREFDALGVGET